MTLLLPYLQDDVQGNETCHMCGLSVKVSFLREHLQLCREGRALFEVEKASERYMCTSATYSEK